MAKKNSYDEVDELLNDIKSDIQDTLLDEVLDEVKRIEIEHVRDDVFGVYKPSIYERRSSGSGGIDDPDNIVGEIYDMRLEVDNITQFNPDYGTFNRGYGLSDLINDGSTTHGYFYDYPGEFNNARPFIDNTIEDIERTDDVENALAKGLKRRKYDIS